MKRRLVAILAGLAAFGLTAAMAASLGGITTTDLGAETSVVAACDADGITVDYTTSFNNGAYEVTSVELGDIDAACDTQDIDVTLYDDTSASLGSGSDVADGSATASVTMDSGIVAEDVVGVAVVISG